jgi:DNA-directed RNA polymerase delta subunit
MEAGLNLNNEILNNLEDDVNLEETFKNFSFDEFVNEVSNSSGVDVENVQKILQTFIDINLKNLKLR